MIVPAVDVEAQQELNQWAQTIERSACVPSGEK